MKRREFLQTTAATCVVASVNPVSAISAPESEASAVAASDLDEITITDLQAALQSGKYTSRQLVEKYLDRIKDIDRNGPRLNSVIEINPDAESIAANLDRERKERGARGPLHGIPILIKDNIDTADRMKTTAGSLALVDAPAPKEDAP